MENPEANKFPFKEIGEPREGGRFFDVRELPRDPAYIVKELKEYQLYWNYEEGEFGGREGFEKAYISDQRLLLNPKYSLEKFLPKSILIKAANEKGGRATYVVAEKIDGKTIHELMSEEKNLAVPLEFLIGRDKQLLIESLVLKLIDIYQDAYDGKQGKVLEIFRSQNIMLGKNLARKDKDNQIYAVDTGPMYSYNLDALETLVNRAIYVYELPPHKITTRLAELKHTLHK